MSENLSKTRRKNVIVTNGFNFHIMLQFAGGGEVCAKHFKPLTPSNEKSAIVAKFLQLIFHGKVSSKPLEFLRYLESFHRNSKFLLSGYLTVHAYLKTNFYENYTI